MLCLGAPSPRHPQQQVLCALPASMAGMRDGVLMERCVHVRVMLVLAASIQPEEAACGADMVRRRVPRRRAEKVRMPRGVRACACIRARCAAYAL